MLPFKKKWRITLDLEDAIAIRNLRDINQAERLLVVRRKKRIKQQQEIAAQNSQVQAEQAAQASEVASQARVKEMQTQAVLDSQKMKLKSQLEVHLETVRHGFNKELEKIKGDSNTNQKGGDQDFRFNLESMKEDRKDDRVSLQTKDQSKLISQRQGKRGEVSDVKETGDVIRDLTKEILNEQANGAESQS